MGRKRIIAKSLIVLFLISGSFLLENCGRPPGVSSDIKMTAQPSFAYINSAIIQTKCIRCHSPGQSASDDDFTSYQGLMADVDPGNPAGSELFQDVSTGKMPKNGPPLSVEEIQMIGEWIALGAPDPQGNTPLPSPTPGPSPGPGIPPTFAAINKLIIQPKCLKCHSGNHPSGHDDFSTYGGVLKEITSGNPGASKFYLDVKSGKMPKKASALSAAEIKAIHDWIQDQASDN